MAFFIGSHQVFAGCGDYLHHSEALRFLSSGDGLHELPPSDDPNRPSCRGANCRSLPFQTPLSNTRTAEIRQQPVGFQVSLLELDPYESFRFGCFDDIQPISALIEVLTPPPIFCQ
jgi:hypothetical protein